MIRQQSLAFILVIDYNRGEGDFWSEEEASAAGFKKDSSCP